MELSQSAANLSRFRPAKTACHSTFLFKYNGINGLWRPAPNRRTLSRLILKPRQFGAVLQLLHLAAWEWKHIFVRPDTPPSLQRRILKYLVEHRLAKDTVEGVVQWWIADRAQPPATLDVQLALDELVRKGWIVVTKRNPNSTLYGLEESCLKEIQEFLKA